MFRSSRARASTFSGHPNTDFLPLIVGALGALTVVGIVILLAVLL